MAASTAARRYSNQLLLVMDFQRWVESLTIDYGLGGVGLRYRFTQPTIDN
ncbi:hypothetical protein [Limnospira platensis]